MSTRCIVGVDDGKNVIASWVACDGYFDGVGRNLLENYNDKKLAETIAQHGTFKSLEDIGNRNQKSLPINMPSDAFLGATIPDIMAEYIYLWDVSQEGWVVYKGKAYSHRETEYDMTLKYPMPLAEVIRNADRGPFVYIVKRVNNDTGERSLAGISFAHREDAVKFCEKSPNQYANEIIELPLQVWEKGA